MKKRTDNSFRPILGQYYLDSHSNTNTLKITGLVKYCPIFYQAECGAFSVHPTLLFRSIHKAQRGGIKPHHSGLSTEDRLPKLMTIYLLRL